MVASPGAAGTRQRRATMHAMTATPADTARPTLRQPHADPVLDALASVGL